MQDADPLLSEDLFQIEIIRSERSSDLTRAVVPHSRRAQTEAGVGDIELMPVAPGAALRDFLARIGDVPGSQLSLDEGCDRASFHELRHGQAFFA